MLHTKTYLKEKREYLTILDFESGQVYQYEVSPNEQYEKHENFIIDMGFNLSNIEWMVSKNEGLIYR